MNAHYKDENHCSALEIFLLVDGLWNYWNRKISLFVHGFGLLVDNLCLCSVNIPTNTAPRQGSF